MSYRRLLSRLATVAVLLSALACAGPSEHLQISTEVPLLEQPYPLDYPSTRTKPNKALRLLNNERVVVISERVDKDFLVYKVRTEDGLEGYVLAEPGVVKQSPALTQGSSRE
jgi:hypothetical protein